MSRSSIEDVLHSNKKTEKNSSYPRPSGGPIEDLSDLYMDKILPWLEDFIRNTFYKKSLVDYLFNRNGPEVFLFIEESIEGLMSIEEL